MERRVQGRGQLQMRVRDLTHGPVFEAHTHAFERTAELQVHRSRRGGLADGHLESQVAARNRGGGSGLSSPARRLTMMMSSRAHFSTSAHTIDMDGRRAYVMMWRAHHASVVSEAPPNPRRTGGRR